MSAREAQALSRPAEAVEAGAAEQAEADWRLVARKEIGDLVGRIGRRPLVRTLLVVAVFGIIVPLRFEGAANLPAFFAIFMAFLPARLVAIDAYAGERERGTLEALLASPLSDRGIGVGKIAASTAYGATRGWLFLATWTASAALLRATGLAGDAPLPSLPVAAAVAVAAVVISYAAAVFGVWQSAAAPSVRSIVESGGTLRLLVILAVFFVVPWLFGLLSPDGRAPSLPVPGTGGEVSLEALRAAVTADTAVLVTGAVMVGVVGAAALWWLTVAALRRSRREELALVTAEGGQRPRTRLLRRR